MRLLPGPDNVRLEQGDDMRTSAILLAFAATAVPAMAQTSTHLTAGEWTCHALSKSGDSPSMDAKLTYAPGGSLQGVISAKIEGQGSTLFLEVALSANWSLESDTLMTKASAIELTRVTIDDRPVAEGMMKQIRGMAEKELGALTGLAGDSKILHLSEHAMVQDEPDSSVSCWR